MQLVKIQWDMPTADGFFGQIFVDGIYVCEAVTNLNKMVAEGLYDAAIDMSPRLGYECPHIAVPDRDLAAGGDAGIRIHIFNEPCQSEGCIGPGTSRDGDAVDSSKPAFAKLMAEITDRAGFKVLICMPH